jgi:hypothetical protein
MTVSRAAGNYLTANSEIKDSRKARVFGLHEFYFIVPNGGFRIQVNRERISSANRSGEEQSASHVRIPIERAPHSSQSAANLGPFGGLGIHSVGEAQPHDEKCDRQTNCSERRRVERLSVAPSDEWYHGAHGDCAQFNRCVDIREVR